MQKLKVMTIFGTRPEANKMAPVIKALEACDKIDSIVAVTGQHREMLDQALGLFNIKPDYDLNIMKAGQSLTEIAVKALSGLSPLIAEVKPDICLVHGDTATTFAGSVAAFYNGVKSGHVEAGLRTNDKRAPFPEEINRRLTSTLADLHFAPTFHSKENLLREGISADNIYITGNTALDAIKNTVSDNYVFECESLNHFNFAEKRVITMTAHRYENLGENMESICRAALRVVNTYPDVAIIWSLHLNPRVRETAYKVLGSHERIHLLDTVNMTDLHNLMKRSYMVLTDSGGLQEEAPFLNKPVLVMRNVTERPEGVETGALKLVGMNEENIYSNACLLLNDKKAYDVMATAKNPFGDGNAAQRIVDALLYYFGYAGERPADLQI